MTHVQSIYYVHRTLLGGWDTSQKKRNKGEGCERMMSQKVKDENKVSQMSTSEQVFQTKHMSTETPPELQEQGKQQEGKEAENSKQRKQFGRHIQG